MTYGGLPVSCAVALANLAVLEQEAILDNVRRNEALFAGLLEDLRDLPIVGDVRGEGYFRSVELVPEPGSRAVFDAEQTEWLLRGFLSPRLAELGLICRTDDRGEPVVVLAPPLIAGPEELGFLASALRQALSEAGEELHRRRRAGS